MQSLTFKPPFQILDVWLVGHRRKRERRRARRFCRGGSRFGVGEEDLFSARVGGLKFRVRYRPSRRHSFLMFKGCEILFPKSRKSRPIYLRIATDKVMDSGWEGVSSIVVPLLFGFILLLLEDRFRIPVVRFGRKIIASLQ